jgi:hypothetical protein
VCVFVCVCEPIPAPPHYLAVAPRVEVAAVCRQRTRDQRQLGVQVAQAFRHDPLAVVPRRVRLGVLRQARRCESELAVARRARAAAAGFERRAQRLAPEVPDRVDLWWCGRRGVCARARVCACVRAACCAMPSRVAPTSGTTLSSLPDASIATSSYRLALRHDRISAVPLRMASTWGGWCAGGHTCAMPCVCACVRGAWELQHTAVAWRTFFLYPACAAGSASFFL